MILSIVTVNYNSSDSIIKTIESVKKQTKRKEFEYIIVDGESTDASSHLIAEEREHIDKLIIEPDGGIYDAMNKGVKVSQGRFVYFLNSGDELFDEETIENLAKVLREEVEDNTIFYGKVAIKNSFVRNERQRENIEDVAFNMIPHQATFMPISCFEEVGDFDLRYKIKADHEILLKAFHYGYKLRFIDYVVAFYDTTGVSSTKISKRTVEHLLVVFRAQGIPLNRKFGLVKNILKRALYNNISHLQGSKP